MAAPSSPDPSSIFADWNNHMNPATSIDFRELEAVCLHYPAIDNHAHPLLKAANRHAVPFDGVISEAEGAAAADAIHTLACTRATIELGRLFQIKKQSQPGVGGPLDSGEDVTWDDIKAVRGAMSYDDLCRLCFAPTRIQCLLLDDGLGGVAELAENYQWHDQFTWSPTRRIVRVEVIAESILGNFFRSMDPTINPRQFMHTFGVELVAQLNHAAARPEVCGFKSVVCYRTGLDVSTTGTEAALDESIIRIYKAFLKAWPSKELRLNDKPLNDLVVQATLTIAAKYHKPVQFHTGLGDNDITLTRSSPAHLQPIIKAHPHATFVLLHSSYPYTRDAGYLTSVYANVYLDFGEIFPFLSSDGQRTVIRQIFELTPMNKIMWSTDGHWWPESYYLGTMQARQALLQVLRQYTIQGDFTLKQAINIAKNAFFHTANRVYGLQLEPIFQN